MRKDAKIGFAIGGVLLAVLAVYAVVVPKKTNLKPAGVTLVTPPAPAHPEPTAPVAGDLPSGGSNPSATDTTSDKSADPIASAGDAAKTSDGVNWAKLLSGNADAPALMSTTPSPDAKEATPAKEGSDAKPAPAADAPAHEKVVAADPAPEALPLLAEGKPAKPATQPMATGRTYTIKPGQTLSSIAGEVYGNQRFYVAILRANPTLNPSRLKPGTKITLPDITDVQPTATTPAATAKTETETAHTAQATGRSYKVEAGDNLYRISRKLFGSPKLAEAIYELNKSEIGPDKTKLKLGMVLQLPSAPSAGATASSR